jgi:hypothetical protein
MKGLSTAEWSLIARHLEEESGPNDLEQANKLFSLHPALREDLEMLGHRTDNTKPFLPHIFNAEKAFVKLSERLKRESLI